MKTNVLLLPGWQNSGPAHWRSRWEALHGFRRLRQSDWENPVRADWISGLEEALRAGAESRRPGALQRRRPFCSVARAQGMAANWGAGAVNVGAVGHFNSASGLGDWPEGLTWLESVSVGEVS